MSDLEKQLARAERSYQRATAKAEAHRIARNQLVLDALAAGWTHAAVAEATGLTRGRVNQIAQAAR